MPSRGGLDPDSARVLDALPARGGAGTSTIAVDAGVDLDTVLRCLGRLAGYGLIETCERGWRLRTPPTHPPPAPTPPPASASRAAATRPPPVSRDLGVYPGLVGQAELELQVAL